jgi:mandelamide amidase
MAQSVADIALLDGVITGEAAPLETIRLKDLRLGVPRRSFFETIEPEVLKIVEALFQRLQQAGVVLVEADPEGMRELLRDLGRAVAFHETPPDIAKYQADSGAPTTLDQIVATLGSPDVAAIFAEIMQNPVSEALYRAARDDRMPRLRALFQDYFARHAVAAIIFPATALTASAIGEDEQVMLCGRPVSTFAAFLRNTEPATLAGLPGIVLPAGRSPDGLPVGVELDGPPGSDRRLLAIAAAIEPFLAPLPAPAPSPAQLR